MIRVLLADDHQMFIDGIKSFLEKDTDIQIVDEALDGLQTLEILENKEVDIVVLDIRMPGMDGVQTIQQLKLKHPKVKVLVVSTFGEGEYVYKMLSNGAEGYMMKNKSKEELLQAIYDIYNGKRFIPHHIQETYWAYIQNKSKLKRENISLTKREIEVLKLIANGLQDKEIAHRLSVGERTVFTHCRNLRKKIDVTNRTELAIYARENGLV